MPRIAEYVEQIRKQPLEGVLTESNQDWFFKDNFLNTAGAIVPYGLAIVYDNGNGDYRLPSATGQKFAGITFRADIYEEAERDYGSGIILAGYPADVNTRINIVKVGLVPVIIDTAFTPNDDLFFRHTANGTGKEVVGRFTTSADTGTADAVTRSEILTSGDAGEIGIVRIW